MMSVVIVLAITVAGPKIGIVATTAFLIVGQFTLATVIDRFGWFGSSRCRWPGPACSAWLCSRPGRR